MKNILTFFVFFSIVNLYNAQVQIDDMGRRNMKIIENQKGIYVLNTNSFPLKKEEQYFVTGQLYNQNLNKIEDFTIGSKSENLLPYLVYNNLSNNKSIEEIMQIVNKRLDAIPDKKVIKKWNTLAQDNNKNYTIYQDQNLSSELRGFNLQTSLFNNNNLYSFNSAYNIYAPLYIRDNRRPGGGNSSINSYQAAPSFSGSEKGFEELGFSYLSANTSISKIDLNSLSINSDDIPEMYRLKNVIWKTNLNLATDAFYKVLGVSNGVVCCLVKTYVNSHSVDYLYFLNDNNGNIINKIDVKIPSISKNVFVYSSLFDSETKNWIVAGNSFESSKKGIYAEKIAILLYDENGKFIKENLVEIPNNYGNDGYTFSNVFEIKKSKSGGYRLISKEIQSKKSNDYQTHFYNDDKIGRIDENIEFLGYTFLYLDNLLTVTKKYTIDLHDKNVLCFDGEISSDNDEFIILRSLVQNDIKKGKNTFSLKADKIHLTSTGLVKENLISKDLGGLSKDDPTKVNTPINFNRTNLNFYITKTNKILMTYLNEVIIK
jgi:hypothetical protein